MTDMTDFQRSVIGSVIQIIRHIQEVTLSDDANDGHDGGHRALGGFVGCRDRGGYTTHRPTHKFLDPVMSVMSVIDRPKSLNVTNNSDDRPHDGPLVGASCASSSVINPHAGNTT